MDRIAERLIYYRKTNELTHSDVAFMLGISQVEYAEMEHANRDMPLKVLVKLLHLYQITMETFLEKTVILESKDEPVILPLEPEITTIKTEKQLAKAKFSVKDKIATTTNAKLPDDLNFDDVDKPRKPLTPKWAVDILRKQGTEVTEEEAGEMLHVMKRFAEITLDQILKTTEWDMRLKKERQGFKFEDKGYGCRICGASAEGGWYDYSGLRCGICQQAILDGIIPPNICGHEELYYTEYELDQAFNLKGEILTTWIRAGIIKQRTIPFANGKGKYYRIFLLKDNNDFFPPKDMLVCHEYLIEEKEGKKWEIPLHWYEIQENPAAYIAGYGITKYLHFT